MQSSSLTRLALTVPGDTAWPQRKKDESVVGAALVLSRRTLGEAACVADIGFMVSAHCIESPLLSSQAPSLPGNEEAIF